MFEEIEERVNLGEGTEGRHSDSSDVAGKGGPIDERICSNLFFFFFVCGGSDSARFDKVIILFHVFKGFDGDDFDNVEEIGVVLVVLFGEACFFFGNFFGSEFEFEGDWSFIPTFMGGGVRSEKNN